MKELVIGKTQNSPGIDFNPTDQILKIEGRSILEKPGEFYDPILNWIHRYFKDPRGLTIIKINLEYVNSSSTKYFLSVFWTIKEYYEKGFDCLIEWYYEEGDEPIFYIGRHFKDTTNLPFDFKVIY